MERILADDFVLVTGNGRRQTKADLLKESSSGEITYEHQEDTDRAVRVWNDTAVVTALLWAKGAQKVKSLNYKLWFSDVYVRTPSGCMCLDKPRGPGGDAGSQSASRPCSQRRKQSIKKDRLGRSE
jgi:hypothetical protein